MGVKLHRGFESRPLRFGLICAVCGFTEPEIRRWRQGGCSSEARTEERPGNAAPAVRAKREPVGLRVTLPLVVAQSRSARTCCLAARRRIGQLGTQCGPTVASAAAEGVG